MQLKIARDAQRAAETAATEIANACAGAVALRGTALIALSGGETPWLMAREFGRHDLPWRHIFVAQVDERVAPRAGLTRNLTRLEQVLVHEGPLPAANLLPMPVEAADVEGAAADYQHQLELRAGTPLVLDLVQLGLGTDGHTASLVPGDPVLALRDRDAAVTGAYQGQRRMTLTLPAIDRARCRLWLVTGTAKRTPLAELLAGTGVSPATAVSRANAIVVADQDAAGPDARGRAYPG